MKKILVLFSVLTVLGCPLFAQEIANPYGFHKKNFIANVGYGGGFEGLGYTANLYYWVFGISYTKSISSGTVTDEEIELNDIYLNSNNITDKFYEIYSFDVKYAIIKQNFFITASFGYYDKYWYDEKERVGITNGYSGGAGILYQYDDKDNKFMDFVMGLEYKSPIGLFFVVGCAF